MNDEVGTYVFEGKDVEEAIEKGLQTLGVSREQVQVEIISQGSKGFLGIGASPARVRLIVEETSAPSMPEAAEEEREEPSPAATAPTELESLAREYLEGILRRLGFDAHVESYWTDGQPGEKRALVLNIQGRDLGLLIGRHAETLSALQYLMRVIMNQQTHRWMNIVVDVENYRRRRQESLRRLALRMAEQVARTGRPVVLEAMPPSERRIIHIALRDHPDVYTVSVGKDPRRKVTIRPKSELADGTSPAEKRGYGRGKRS